jgi:hypothetical protein
MNGSPRRYWPALALLLVAGCDRPEDLSKVPVEVCYTPEELAAAVEVGQKEGIPLFRGKVVQVSGRVKAVEGKKVTLDGGDGEVRDAVCEYVGGVPRVCDRVTVKGRNRGWTRYPGDGPSPDCAPCHFIDSN